MFSLITKNKSHAFFYFIGFVFLGIAFWVKRHIGVATVDQVISTYVFGIAGLFKVDDHLISQFIRYGLLGPFLLTLIALTLENCLKKIQGLNPNKIHKWGNFGAVLLISYGLFSVERAFSVLETLHYLVAPSTSNHPKIDYLAQEYQNPEQVEIKAPSQPKSLILIYVESLETTYSNKNLFGRDLLLPLKNIKTKSLRFEQFEQLSGADWTIAGMVASQCGIPLKLISFWGNNQQPELTPKFLINAVCLSDILAAKGYKNIFLTGTSLPFAGVGNFLTSHHYAEQYGREQWLDHGFKKKDLNNWGLPDDLLFEQAKIKVAKLINEQKPFNLTILTVNTHGVNGYINKTCNKRGAKNFEDIVECTAYEVADFVNFIETKGWFKHVNVVIMGDHLAMTNAVSNKIATIKQRYVFNQFFGINLPSKNRESIVHFDMLPSILRSLGFSFSPQQLALGKSGLGNIDLNATKMLNKKQWDEIIKPRSQLYDELWIHSVT